MNFVTKSCFHNETFLISKCYCKASPAVHSQFKASGGSKCISAQGDIPEL